MYLPTYHGAYYGNATSPSIAPPKSVSVGPTSEMAVPKNVPKSRSTNSLRTLAAMQAAELREQQSSFHTIRDPRMASTSDLSEKSSSSHVGDVKDEVAVLSDKLISAINHQQTLDDNLAEARHELETERARIEELEARLQSFEARLASKDLMTKESVEQYNEKLRIEAEETRRRNERLLQEKRSLQSEMDDLSASLFEEANKRVANANEQQAATEKKNQQLRDQIKDGEAVIASQAEQLAGLKLLMQEIGSEQRKEPPNASTDSPNLTPASPIAPKDDNLNRLLEAMNLTPITPDHPDIAPSPSTQLVHLVKPLCRTDIPCYEDFRQMLLTGHRSHTPSHAASRAGSGSYGGLSGLGLSALSQTNASSPNLNQSNAKLAPSPGLPGSFSPAPDSKGPHALKDTRFFKRLMLEDIEPTLRLDLSPQISWLQRRSILAAVSDSTLIVEPIPEASIKLYGKYTACSVCGENRREGENPRTHAMRSREGEGANKFAVCTLCLEKVRAVCDLIAYVRMVRDGVVKIADLKDEEEVWEEVIRLRERLFWARLAGGVVPAFVPTPKIVTDAQAATSPGFKTPESGSRRPSDQSDEASMQLQRSLEESEGLTTFANAREKALQNVKNSPTTASTPNTPRHKARESSGSGFPKITIPKFPSGLFEGQVNALH